MISFIYFSIKTITIIVFGFSHVSFASVIYKCIDENGHTTYTQVPCTSDNEEKGGQENRQHEENTNEESTYEESANVKSTNEKSGQ